MLNFLKSVIGLELCKGISLFLGTLTYLGVKAHDIYIFPKGFRAGNCLYRDKRALKGHPGGSLIFF